MLFVLKEPRRSLTLLVSHHPPTRTQLHTSKPTLRTPVTAEATDTIQQNIFQLNTNLLQGMLACQSYATNNLPTMATDFDLSYAMSRMSLQYSVFDPNPRDPPNGRAPPQKPRPGKPPQPRDDGCSRSLFVCYGGAQKPSKPQPRDPGNGRQYSMGPYGRAMSGQQGKPPTRPNPPKEPSPRDGGKKGGKRLARDPNPRDPGMLLPYIPSVWLPTSKNSDSSLGT